MASNEPVSRYLQHLPAVFQAEPFLGRFLLAFERILGGLDLAQEPQAVEQILDRIHTYFQPGGDGEREDERAPAEFLPWLAGWVATSLRDDWDEETRRRFIRRIPALYRLRGTPAGLKEMLRIYLGSETDIEIHEDDNTPYYFRVSFSVAERDATLLARRFRIAQAIIEQEKPAHTFYGLAIRYPQMQIVTEGPNRLTVGKNTVLGSGTLNVKL
ncbi:phage tail protein [Hyalangium gracile]|uniref:phage tail protein n=1 Tax=Hyalangium gracile TaxID=394092 RepID=UPI001CC91FA4|nr:phage tail protein [Hyalangium gracile]